MGHLEANLGYLEASFGHLEANLGHLEVNLGHLKTNLGHLEANLGHLESNQGYLEANLVSAFTEKEQRDTPSSNGHNSVIFQLILKSWGCFEKEKASSFR